MFRIAVVLGSVLATLPAASQTLLTPEAFLDEALGKTLSFHDMESGALVGREHFLRRDLTVWKRPGEPCVYGYITTPDGQICFRYEDRPGRAPVCWWPYMQDDRLLVRLATFFDAEIQEVRAINAEPIECPNVPTS